MKVFLGVDGGGSWTEFVLITAEGAILATHEEGSAYYLETGLDALQMMIAGGIRTTLARAHLDIAQLTYAFLGIPAHGEDSHLQQRLDRIASPTLPATVYRCGNDMIAGWAGALAGSDGINVVAGTGSIAYGEYAGRSARAGGWGELFSDEGSAHWIAREGLTLFARMSDARAPRGPLYALVRGHFGLESDLDLCAVIYGAELARRSKFAQLGKLVSIAADQGDTAARDVFVRGAAQLAELVEGTRRQLQVPDGLTIPVSYSGAMFYSNDLTLQPLRAALSRPGQAFQLVTPRLRPGLGAALYAARCAGTPLGAAAIARLELQQDQFAVADGAGQAAVL